MTTLRGATGSQRERITDGHYNKGLIHMAPARGQVTVRFENGRTLSLPVAAVAKHRAARLMHQFNNKLHLSLQDTVNLLKSPCGTHYCEEWIRREMNMDDLVTASTSDNNPNASDIDYDQHIDCGSVDILQGDKR